MPLEPPHQWPYLAHTGEKSALVCKCVRGERVFYTTKVDTLWSGKSYSSSYTRILRPEAHDATLDKGHRENSACGWNTHFAVVN